MGSIRCIALTFLCLLSVSCGQDVEPPNPDSPVVQPPNPQPPVAEPPSPEPPSPEPPRGGNGGSGNVGDGSTCDRSKLSACAKAISSRMPKIMQKLTEKQAMSGGQPDASETRRVMCGVGQDMVKCIIPAIKGCGEDMEKEARKALTNFNKEPISCNIHLTSQHGSSSVGVKGDIRTIVTEIRIQKPRISEVDLANGTSWRGRLRVKVGDEWGSVCHDGLDWKFAKVACISMGLQPKEAITVINHPIVSNYHGSILLHKMKCRGFEQSLNDCQFVAYNKTRDRWCDRKTVGVDCGAPPLTASDVHVRLRDHLTTRNHSLAFVNGRGRLEVRVENDPRWGMACQTGFDDAAAKVVCRMLGYPTTGAKSVWYSAYHEGRGEHWISDIKCTGHESHIMECREIRGWGRNRCARHRIVGIDCTGQSSLSLVPLSRGTSPANGLVRLMYHNLDRYDTVRYMCGGVSFDPDVAKDMCTMLGFSGSPARIYPSSMFTDRRSSAWLEGYFCPSPMGNISECTFEHLGAECDNKAALDCDDSLPFDGVRLVGGYDAKSGRVELSRKGKWGTVCYDRFGKDEAATVCRSLGLSPENAKVFRHRFGEGDTARSWSDKFVCGARSDVTNLFECSDNVFSGGCSVPHNGDVGVTCYDQGDAPVVADGTVRLIGGYTPSSGHVEIYQNQKWASICNDGFDNNDARVVCRMAGHDSEEASVVRTIKYGYGNGDILLDDVVCNGNESSVLDCAHRPLWNHDCTNFEAVAVDCYGLRTETELKVRLNKERVEVLHSGQWGSVCDDFIGEQEVKVICRQLDLGTAEVSWESRHAHESADLDGPIWLDNVKCTGDEATIGECAHSPLGEHNCGHAEDIYVKCN